MTEAELSLNFFRYQDELLRLQNIVIGGSRFTKMGYRIEGGLVGEYDRKTGEPIPEHISARWQVLETLMKSLAGR